MLNIRHPGNCMDCIPRLSAIAAGYFFTQASELLRESLREKEREREAS